MSLRASAAVDDPLQVDRIDFQTLAVLILARDRERLHDEVARPATTSRYRPRARVFERGGGACL